MSEYRECDRRLRPFERLTFELVGKRQRLLRLIVAHFRDHADQEFAQLADSCQRLHTQRATDTIEECRIGLGFGRRRWRRRRLIVVVAAACILVLQRKAQSSSQQL